MEAAERIKVMYTFPVPAGIDPGIAYIVDMIGLGIGAAIVVLAFWWAWKKR